MMIYKRKLLLIAAVAMITISATAQDAGYKLPPQQISDLLLAKTTPTVSITDKGDWMLLTSIASYPSVEELARPELKIAGLRIDPNNFSPSRQRFITSVSLKETSTGKEFQVTGLPTPLAAGSFSWSPDDKKIAFVNTTRTRVDLYMIDVATKKATRINKTALNVILSDFYWLDNTSLLYNTIVQPVSAAPQQPLMPKGPAIQENAGKAAPRPTFQDMIKTPHDEELFAFYTTTQPVKNTNGIETKLGKPAIYLRIDPSPDKKFFLQRTIKKPFSYLVPVTGFAYSLDITDNTGKLVKHVADITSSETAPSGNDNVQPFARGYNWRNDQPSTIYWCTPLDSGMIKKNVEYRDAVYESNAPFTTEGTLLFKTKMRFNGVTWGDKNTALVYEGLRGKQLTQIDRYSLVTGDLEKLFSRNSTDAYSSPGAPVMIANQYHEQVLLFTDNGNKIFFNNMVGSSPKGDLPFVLLFDIHTKKADTIWRCPEDKFEYMVKLVDPDKRVIITRRESEKEVPNYWLKNLKLRIADQPLTRFTDPYPQLEGISKEKVSYKREDGVTLTGDLYLPKDYNAKKDGPLPVFIWAYPAEYNSAADAAQIRGSLHRFTTISWGSPIFYATQGYAVLNNAEMPIVSLDSSKKPNDNFVEQLRMNAKAAIEKLAVMGVGDSTRVAVGGHSYGAFMTANLLAHTNYFKAGIARSGAYNRTLTPFGFQNEDRTYWQAPELYHDMSPFSYANQIKTPLLLIHGDADNNTGTFPIQSERMYNAIKGHGGTVKYVSLPFESHGYQGKENLLHMLYEQFEWLEKYVKHANDNSTNKKKGF